MIPSIQCFRSFSFFLAWLTTLQAVSAEAGIPGNIKDEKKEVVITILYDNYPYKEGLSTGWGFACLIEGLEKTILFDTGNDDGLLIRNMKALDIDPDRIGMIVLSHNHLDHTGGLMDIAERNSRVTVCVPDAFPRRSKERIRDRFSRLITTTGPARLTDNVMTTGEMGFMIKEQSLIIKTPSGPVLITGCAHPGITNIVERMNDLTGEEPLLVLGGFHLISKSNSEIREIVSEMKEKQGVRYVSPSHCTGDKAIGQFRESFGKSYIRIGVGKQIKISEIE